MGANLNPFCTFRPLIGGIAIQNPNVEDVGTLGFIATSDGFDRWIVSCFHVLCRTSGDFPTGINEFIFQPFRRDGELPIAEVTAASANRRFDVAAARVLDVECTGQVLGIGNLRQPAAPAIGMRVIKSGAETGITEGRVMRVTAEEIEVTCADFSPDYSLSGGGDSGAVWLDAATLAPVAIHLAGNAPGSLERAIARPIELALSVLNLNPIF